MKRVIGYARVSTEDQAVDGVSLDNQRRKIELYAEINDMELVEVVADEGISAKNLNRPGVMKVLEIARKRDVDGIIILKLDRMFRNTIDALKTAQELEKWGVALHSITENLDTQSAIGKFFFTLMASLAEMERNQIGERTSTALQYKKSQGETTGNTPYGFQLCSDGVHIEPCEPEQRVVAVILDLRTKGFSYRSIANKLNQSGLQTRKGTEWKHQYVANIIKAA